MLDREGELNLLLYGNSHPTGVLRVRKTAACGWSTFLADHPLRVNTAKACGFLPPSRLEDFPRQPLYHAVRDA